MMGNGTIQAKLEPLSMINDVNNIYFLRKKIGPEIPKVHYLILPYICKYSVMNILVTPIVLAYYIYKYDCKYIISYHIIPYAFIASIASIITRIPYFICQTGLMIQSYSKNKILWFVLDYVIKKSKKLCVPGSLSKKFWESKDVPVSKILCLHSTINTEKYKSDDASTISYDFIYVGRFSPEKNLTLLIEAFDIVKKEFTKCKMLMIGDGPELCLVKNLSIANNVSSSISFMGYQDDVLSYLKSSRFIVLTSKTEGLPCAIMEAMSTGVIPITTDVGNLSDIVIDNVTGFLAVNNDANSFAFKMKSALKMNEESIIKMKNQARKIITDNHSHLSSITKWETLFSIRMIKYSTGK